jgi:hypothetical protein
MSCQAGVMQPSDPDQPAEPRYEPAPSLRRVAFFAFGGVVLTAVFFLVVVLVMLHS